MIRAPTEPDEYRAGDLLLELHLAGVASAAVVGCIEAGEPGRIRVRRRSL
jgi:hypothetical protein